MSVALPTAAPGQVRRAFVALLGTERWRVTVAVALRVLAAAAATSAPLLLGRMIDGLAAGSTGADIDRLAVFLAASIAAAIALTWLASYTASRLAERLAARIRERFVDRCLHMPLHTAEQAGSGDLMTRSTVDVPEAANLIRTTLPNAAVSVLTAVVYLGAMLWVSPVLTLSVLLAVPSMAAGSRWYLARARAGYLRQRSTESDAGEALAASSDGARTTALLGLGEARRRLADDTIAAHWAANRYTLYLRSVYFASLESSYLLPTAGVLLLGGGLHFAGAVSVGTVATCAVLSRQAMTPLYFLLMQVERLQRGFASLARLEDGADVDAQSDHAVSVPPRGAVVELRDVHFAYRTGGDVLHGVDLTVPQGQRLAVVGPSGAGKSTLARLIAGIDAPRRGAVTLGGVPVAAMPLTRRRSHVTLVTQEHHVFAASLRDNLILARDGAGDHELTAALSTVGARWALELPDGLDTMLGGTDGELDPAAAQQIALARIILADPDVVVLDEATAMLDPRAARDTERALAAVLASRTVIAIAHRLHTAHDADRIAVVEDGRISELGSHVELLKLDRAYANLWRSWHGEEVPAHR
ncbi:MAG TPA: ABC transporter ATP-binding protein [Micromonosporaceae bacterium]|nr:ABC transporter ATP-binding protein [Micromonosporaceae bacterium]